MLTVRSSIGSLPPQALDLTGDNGGIIVFPCPDNEPPISAQGDGVPLVPGLIGIELAAPPSGIRLGGDGMLRTAVPEAAVNEHGDAGAGQHDVRAPRQPPGVDPESEAATMQGPAQRELGSGTRCPQARHETLHRGARCGWSVECTVGTSRHR